jgi:hypothetical protein
VTYLVVLLVSGYIFCLPETSACDHALKNHAVFCIVSFVVRDVDVRIQVIKEFDIGISNYETDYNTI